MSPVVQSDAEQHEPGAQEPLQHLLPAPHWESTVQDWQEKLMHAPLAHWLLLQHEPAWHAPPQQTLPAPHWALPGAGLAGAR